MQAAAAWERGPAPVRRAQSKISPVESACIATISQRATAISSPKRRNAWASIS